MSWFMEVFIFEVGLYRPKVLFLIRLGLAVAGWGYVCVVLLLRLDSLLTVCVFSTSQESSESVSSYVLN